jgi:hypothetical protein
MVAPTVRAATSTEGRIVLCALTVRKLKPGTFEDFKAALRGGPIWPDPDVRPTPAESPSTHSGWKRFYALQNVEDEDEVITFGLFDGSLEDLRARQGKGGYGQRRQKTDQLVEAKLADGVYEVLVERSLGQPPSASDEDERSRCDP